MRSRIIATSRAPMAVLAMAFLLAACTGRAVREPTLPSVNFTPKLVLEVDENGFTWKRGSRDDPNVTIPAPDGPPTVPYGTAMEVTNTGTQQHWVDAGKTFNTGRMNPGERTVIGFTEDLTEPKTVEIVDRDRPDHKTTIVVQPKPQDS